MTPRTLLASLIGLTLSAAACAAPDLRGAWTATVPGQGGMTQVTEAYEADGHFVSVRREPNGTLLRIWGRYREVSLGGEQLRLDSTIENWSPHQICGQAPGFAMQCSAFTPPAPQPVVLDFIAPDAFRVGGVVVHRDPEARLLAQTVPDRLVLAVAAPAPPAIAPIAPIGGRRYVTPRDPSAGPGRDDLQQRRICSINGGSLVVVGGRLTCVN